MHSLPELSRQALQIRPEKRGGTGHADPGRLVHSARLLRPISLIFEPVHCLTRF